ncbi:acyl-CoA desaturase [Burkholderia vietnamiensis]|jgi:stearoyl-CoA desaturase (delta-9 desaturase)|uniref:Acyl-CoA desaturase n=1 Tax=Burkholderia vietnamiensis TaxID=60552 RepID=A0ABS1AZ77_BURVI|nr:acyl-CoA desaturase [Burkholderia vietnamiensis]KVF38767.1 fatty acid desaturase [Burkholderia vietnamiensis]KVR65411.1 fatty acid desaturase [Burkholderia vietnamiensis]KVR91883.1 fatty acid desaturase [Burkholderia vietnamiensis]MBJ9689455.1 acyl-CoA desaturase [Burkholderia vietnamiensis]MBR8081234.1 acyl-CoA desaturase [Burkholderia vietnamiensis]
MNSSIQVAPGVTAAGGLSAADGQIPGVSPLLGSGARVKRLTALAVMLVPLAGFALAVRQLALGEFAATDLVLFAVFYFLHMGGITMGFHRYLAHKTFRTSKWFEGLLLICGSMAAQGPIMFWVTTHRRHHLYSDQQGDPHSPNLAGKGLFAKLRGLWYAHMPWMLAPDVSGWTFFAPDVLRDRRLFFYHRTYAWWIVLGLVLPAAIGGAVAGSWLGAWNGLLFGGLARIFVANQAAWCVGSVCHMFGGRPFKTGDNSANNWTVAVFTFGEGLQNNHHAFPASYRHSVKWYEPDLSAWVLWTLGKLGIVRDLRQPTPAAIRKLAKQPY